MRVLLVTAEYSPGPSGGIGIFYRDLARELAAEGATVCVLASDPTVTAESRQQEGGVEVHRTPVPPAGKLTLRLGPLRLDGGAAQRARALSAAAGRIAAEFQPDVVETHDWSAPLWRPPSRPFVVRLHGSSSALAAGLGRRPARLLRMLERRMLAQADVVVAVSDWIRTLSARVFKLPAERMRTIANGVDIERFSPGDDRRCEEVVYAGTLREDKGVVELLQALEIVFRERPGATATLAGGPDGWRELAPRIRSHVERLQLAAPNRLRLLGRVGQERLVELHRRAGACVFPSHVESFGLACVEAMSCGAAVIASRLGAASEIVTDGQDGLLVDPRDPEKIAAAVLNLLERPEQARTLGAHARRTVVERYSMRATAENTLALYRELRRPKQQWLPVDAA